MEAELATKQRSCIAWFKLAQFIERGERERALGMFRLLTHAVAQQAFTNQLEGDLLLAFDNLDQAREQYIKATQLYAHESDYNSAISIFEHLLRNNLLVDAMIPAMIRIYAKLRDNNRTLYLVQSLAKANSSLLIKVTETIVELNVFGNDLALYGSLALSLITEGNCAGVAIVALLRHPYFKQNQSQQESILATLRITNVQVYKECMILLQNN